MARASRTQCAIAAFTSAPPMVRLRAPLFAFFICDSIENFASIVCAMVFAPFMRSLHRALIYINLAPDLNPSRAFFLFLF
jgi:hypothetical protein